MARARLLRHLQPQRQGGLPALPRLVRRQPGQPQSAAAVERATKAVEYMGGAEAAIARAREDFAKGEYRWVAEVMSQVVFAEPDNSEARELRRRRAGAARLPGRVGHLAQRLPARRARAARRHAGCRPCPSRAGARHRARAERSTCSSTSSACASTARRPRARPPSSTGSSPIPAERYALTLQNCALTYLAGRHAAAADCTVTLDRATLNRVILRELALPEALGAGPRRRSRATARRSPSCSACSTISRWASR